MKKIAFLLLIIPFALAGCFQLPGQMAKTQGVQKGPPPPVDPKLAPSPTEAGQNRPVTQKQAQVGGNGMTHTTVARPSLDPADLHHGNAYQAVDQLGEAISQDRNSCPSHGVAGCPHCEKSWPR
jgi:hypothetical protein